MFDLLALLFAHKLLPYVQETCIYSMSQTLSLVTPSNMEAEMWYREQWVNETPPKILLTIAWGGGERLYYLSVFASSYETSSIAAVMIPNLNLQPAKYNPNFLEMYLLLPFYSTWLFLTWDKVISHNAFHLSQWQCSSCGKMALQSM